MTALTRFGPATKRILAQIQFGYDFTLIWIEVVNLTIRGPSLITTLFRCGFKNKGSIKYEGFSDRWVEADW